MKFSEAIDQLAKGRQGQSGRAILALATNEPGGEVRYSEFVVSYFRGGVAKKRVELNGQVLVFDEIIPNHLQTATGFTHEVRYSPSFSANNKSTLLAQINLSLFAKPPESEIYYAIFTFRLPSGERTAEVELSPLGDVLVGLGRSVLGPEQAVYTVSVKEVKWEIIIK
jgi:hypothetical protein